MDGWLMCGRITGMQSTAMIIEEIAINNFDLLVIIFCIEGVMGCVFQYIPVGISSHRTIKIEWYIHRIGSMYVLDDLNNT
jgi:hypothetical protein